MAKNHKFTKQEKEDMDIIIKHTRPMFEELFNTTVDAFPLSYTAFGVVIVDAVFEFIKEYICKATEKRQ